MNLCQVNAVYDFSYTDVNMTWRNNGKMIPPNYFCINKAISFGSNVRRNYYLIVNRSESDDGQALENLNCH